MNDSGAFDKPVSIRQVLMDNKVDISFLDLMVWSPAACREMKCLCTRVTKKKDKKAVLSAWYRLQSVGSLVRSGPASVPPVPNSTVAERSVPDVLSSPSDASATVPTTVATTNAADSISTTFTIAAYAITPADAGHCCHFHQRQ